MISQIETYIMDICGHELCAKDGLQDDISSLSKRSGPRFCGFGSAKWSQTLSAAGRLDATIETHSQVGFVIGLKHIPRSASLQQKGLGPETSTPARRSRFWSSFWTSSNHVKCIWDSLHFQFPVQGAACWIHRRYDGSACGPHWPWTQNANALNVVSICFNKDQLYIAILWFSESWCKPCKLSVYPLNFVPPLHEFFWLSDACIQIKWHSPTPSSPSFLAWRWLRCWRKNIFCISWHGYLEPNFHSRTSHTSFHVVSQRKSLLGPVCFLWEAARFSGV